MSDQQDVTLGEVYRLCERIEAKVDKTNGRVTDLERDATRIKAYGSVAIIGGGLVLDWVRHKMGWS